MDLHLDPVSFFHSKFSQLRDQQQTFAVATVIETEGSASARVGAKAIFDEQGKNIEGWVGGGCAERFIGEQSVLALQERKSHIITADMDDAIFGLGVVCGGKMRIFIEPFFPAEKVLLPRLSQFAKEAEFLAATYGWDIQWSPETQKLEKISELFVLMAQAISDRRELSGASLRLLKNLPVTFKTPVQTADSNRK